MTMRFHVYAMGIALLVGSWSPAGADHVGDPCMATVTTAGGVLLACPAGDGPTLASIGATISVRLVDSAGTPVPGVPAADFWINPPVDFRLAPLCGGWQSCPADHATDDNGETTISGSVAAGGLVGSDLFVCVQGIVLLGSASCLQPLPLVIVSPDIDGNLTVDVLDFARFGMMYPPNAYDPRADMNGDAVIGVSDLALFTAHMGHACGL